ncbi:hypothetical protein HYW17_02325 [Candidatus Uhrbacteria bacterium]|nr:hypothetical protein [Candidatus Uhrbacteria bacterium]
MNLYECEGKKLFQKHGIKIPRGLCIHRGEEPVRKYQELGIKEVVAKAQVLSGKRGKNAGIRFCSSEEEVRQAAEELLSVNLRGQYVAAVRIEEKLDIAQEHYVSITYDTSAKAPVLIYSEEGGVDIEEVPRERIKNYELSIKSDRLAVDVPCAQELWNCFLKEDARLAEINPLVKTKDGRWIAADAKVALDDDAWFRHEEWKNFPPRTMLGRLPTKREVEVKKIDEGEAWYRGTAGKYLEMDGDIAILFSGGGASIANMDALEKHGLQAANYTEYSGNPPREKVYALAKIVLSKPGLRGLWIAGGVANFTSVKDTFQGIADALDEIRPAYPIVARRAGPYEKEGLALLKACAKRNNLKMKLFGKEISMSETAKVLTEMVAHSN